MSDQQLYHEEYRPPFLPALVLGFPVMPFFWHYHVTITKSNLGFGYNYGVTQKNTALSTVKSAEPIEHVNGLKSWGGWGIRLNLSGDIGYIATNGPAVRVVLDNDGKDKAYVFNCKDPEKVCSLLNSRGD